MDPELVTRMAAVVTSVVGAGVILGPFVSYGVNVAKRMIPTPARRRAALPLLALLLGWSIAALFLALVGQEMTLISVALCLLIGGCAAKAADEAAAKHSEAKRRD